VKLGDRIDSFPVVVVDGQTIRAPRPATGIVLEPLGPARTPRTARRLIASETFRWLRVRRCVESFLCSHGSHILRIMTAAFLSCDNIGRWLHPNGAFGGHARKVSRTHAEMQTVANAVRLWRMLDSSVAVKPLPLPPCPRCHQAAGVEEEEHAGSTLRWFRCTLCSHVWSSSPRPH
jgi:hypothetical protein